MSRVYYIACGILLVIIGIILLMSFSLKEKTNAGELYYNRDHPAQIVEISEPDLTIKEGYVSQKEETVKIIREGKVIAKVMLSEPILVAQADKEEKWGFFQFPGIGRTDDGKLVVSWQMNEDSHKAYGNRISGKKISKDGGKTWTNMEQNGFVKGGWCLELRNGDLIQILTPTSKVVDSYQSFPSPLIKDPSLKMDFYLESELPNDLRGMYLNKRKVEDKSFERIHGELYDPGLMRYSMDDVMPLMWWGEIKELEDGSLVGGIYRTYYQNQDNEIPKSCITFYKSTDEGCHWKAIGRIPYNINEMKDNSRKYDRTRGFSEASFEILRDSTYLCVMRTGHNTPMYKSFSHDCGKHWTKPEAFTSNGVKPKLLLLDNGALVLASGRPGLQLRFSINGDGKNWTEPIDMMPYLDINGGYDMMANSCGYPALLQIDRNTFFLVYSDFKTKDKNGDYRKAVFFRKVTVLKYK